MNQKIRDQFPLLQHKPVVYFDNAATVQKPRAVLNASRDYYEQSNANIHRGVHRLSREATVLHEEARKVLAQFINSSSENEIIFTSGTTESINLVANILSDSGLIQEGDEIVISYLDHHSNLVPWQMLSQRCNATLRAVPVTSLGELDLIEFDRLINSNTKIVAVGHVSNALGTINPVKQLIKKAKSVGAMTLVDGAQAISHMEVDVQDLDCDFYAFSGHKMYAPTGIGVLYGKKELLNKLPPWKGGGEMIKKVSIYSSTYNDLPFKYEAGTPNIEGAIALAVASKWMMDLGIGAIERYEADLLKYALKQMSEIQELELIGRPKQRAGVISFGLKDVHHYDLGTILDKMGVAVRTGHHCCQPLMDSLAISGTTRASFAVYNTFEEVDKLLESIKRAVTLLA